MKWSAAKTLSLYRSCGRDHIEDFRGRGIVFYAGGEIFIRYFRTIRAQIDAVEEGTGDFSHVPADVSGSAAAAVGVGIAAAGTGVHGCQQEKIGRKAEGSAGSGYHDFPVFKRLAEYFESGAGKFRKFIEEEDSPMCKGDFTGNRYFSAAGEIKKAGRKALAGSADSSPGCLTEGNRKQLRSRKRSRNPRRWKNRM